ncbi:Rv3235 family protein [Demequina salsinemoris]|uniref:Rv3235 family protein n=1 Tax=Demequina salsinemoris TaxID=577470 RepID=UPI000783D52F|nr:Rv3235 family protein [Demequina salsinemoris]
MSAQPIVAGEATARPLDAGPVISARPAGAPARRSPYDRRRRPLGDPSPLACTLAKAALEAVHGAPTLDSLTRWVDPKVVAALSKQHSLARRSGTAIAGSAQIVRARVCRVALGAAEVSVVARHGDRVHALALRLEDRQGRWVATVIDVG